LILSSVSKYKIAKLPAPEVAWVKFKEHNIHLPLTTDEHSAPRPSNQPYRPALDGLRALAILPVLVFHLKASWFPGGFVGVDVFFVISGYLITNLILRECERGDFSFRRFYQRRIARLFPSMALVLAISAGAILMLYDQRMIGDNGPHMAESVLSVANIFSAHEENGYFGITKDAHPFLHFWSLSVEEQFYVFFPMTFLFLWRWGRRRLNFSLASLLILSLAYCVWKTRVNQSWSFYMLPTRAWGGPSAGFPWICALDAFSGSNRHLSCARRCLCDHWMQRRQQLRQWLLLSSSLGKDRAVVVRAIPMAPANLLYGGLSTAPNA
jgi:hypothetical protein